MSNFPKSSVLAVTLTASSSKHETGEQQRLTCESHKFVGFKTRIFLEYEINLSFIGPCIANIFEEYNQQDATFLKFIYFYKTLYMFQTFAHTASGICQTNLLLAWMGCSIPSRLAAGSSNSLTNTWRCMCSFELLMMDGKTAWNM